MIDFTNLQHLQLILNTYKAKMVLFSSDKLVGEEGNTLLIPCMLPQLQYNFTLTWTFIRTLEPIMILIYDSRSRRITNSWEKKAELNIQAQMGNGSLTLFNPESSAHTGLYTCTLSSFQVKHQVHTWVNVTVQVTGTIWCCACGHLAWIIFQYNKMYRADKNLIMSFLKAFFFLQVKMKRFVNSYGGELLLLDSYFC